MKTSVMDWRVGAVVKHENQRSPLQDLLKKVRLDPILLTPPHNTGELDARRLLGLMGSQHIQMTRP